MKYKQYSVHDNFSGNDIPLLFFLARVQDLFFILSFAISYEGEIQEDVVYIIKT